MNFLKIIGQGFGYGSSGSSSGSEWIAEEKPVAIVPVLEQGKIQEVPFGLLPKRVRRIMNLSREGGYGIGAQIEGVKVSSLWATAFVRLWEGSNEAQRRGLTETPMVKVFLFVNKLIDMGKL